MRWLVGDLQGCARALEGLLKQIDFEVGRDELWCCGDLINRGPDSLDTLRLFKDLGGKGVMGNHEVYAISAFDNHWPRKHDTLEALFNAPDADELIESLRALPLLAHLPAEGAAVGDVWVVHGGLHPAWTDLPATAARLNDGHRDQAWLERPETKLATRLRCCNARGEMSRHDKKPEDCPAGFAPWDSFRAADAAPKAWVVHGHWAWRGHYRNAAAKVIGLDSGCVYGGPLTAWCVEQDRIVEFAP